MKRRAILAGAIIALAGNAANASVYFTFPDPSTDLEVHYQQPDVGQDHGTMTYNADFVDLTIDATANGSGVLDFDAVLNFIGWEVSDITSSGMTTSATVTGTFEFNDYSSGNTILTGQFDTGLVITAVGAGSIVTSTDGGLMYTPGPALTAVAPEITGFTAPQDASFTLTDITFEQFMTVMRDGKTYFGSFDANAAYTGTTEGFVPTPGASSLAALGVLGLIQRRRRRA